MRTHLRNRIFGLTLVLAAVSTVAATPPGSLSRAIAAQEALLAASPGDARAVNDHGNLLLLAGREEAAEEAYLRAVELDPHLQSARFNLALLLEQRGELRAAREQLRVVVDALPDHAWAHFQLGRIAERQGRDRDAIKAYATAFHLDAALSFPEVNPQVIDSALVTKALLQTRSDIRMASEAPRMYEQPGRIASLLLPALPPETAGGVEGALEAAEPETAEVAVEAMPASRGMAEPREETERKTRVLSPSDLPTGSRVGEATPAVPAQTDTNQRYRERLQRVAPQGQPQSPDNRGYRPGTPSAGQSRLQIREDG